MKPVPSNEKQIPSDEEIARRLLDPRYFIERCFTIIDQSSREVPFFFNPLQIDFVPKITGQDIILKSRKMGFSAVITAILLHACLTRPYTRAVIISHEDDATKRMFRRVKHYLKSLGEIGIQVKTEKDSENEVILPHTKSWLYIGTAGAKSFGRGDDITHGHLSESAHYDNREVITGVQEALIKGTKTFLFQESTAKGAGTKFHQSWLRAVNGESNWKAHFYGWHQDPLNRVKDAEPFILNDEERKLKGTLNLDWEQLAWRRKKLADMEDPSLYPQEYPATWQEAFLASGGMLFDWSAIHKNEETALKPKWKGNIIDAGGRIDIVPDAKGPLEIYITPNDRTKYLITADTALGVPGGANSVADVYDMRTWEQVAQWRGHAAEVPFGDVCARLGAFYGWSLIACENNYPGNAVLQRLSEIGYPNIWDEPGESGDQMGFNTSSKSKAQYIAAGREALKDGSLKINSKHTLNEMSTFVLLENGKVGPQDGCLQDTVITSCKAADILKRVHLDPELNRPKFRDIMGLRRRTSAGPSGGRYNTGVV